MNTLLLLVLILGAAVAYYVTGVIVSFAAQTRYRKPYDFPDWDSLILIWPAVLPGLIREALAKRSRSPKGR